MGHTQSQLQSTIQQNISRNRHNWYNKCKQLGEGAFGEVFLCSLISNGDRFALKIVYDIKKGPLSSDKVKDVNTVREDLIMKQLSHNNIIEYYAAEFVGEELHIFMEYAQNGSLKHSYDTYGPLIDHQIAQYTRQILSGLRYLHSLNLHHHDIKCDNILLTADDVVKLSDFGIAIIVKSKSSVCTNAGGDDYWSAPEIRVREEHTCAADIWSLGATVLEMKLGDSPSQLDNRQFTNARPLEAYEEEEGVLSPMVLEFISLCLKTDYEERASIDELLNSPLCCMDRGLSRTEHETFLSDLKNYNLQVSSFLQLYPCWRTKRLETMEILKRYARKLHHYRYQSNTCSFTSAASGIVSGACIIASLCLAPVTAGASLVLVGGGMSVGVAGCAVYMGGTIGELLKSNSAIKASRKALECDRDDTVKMNDAFSIMMQNLQSNDLAQKIRYFTQYCLPGSTLKTLNSSHLKSLRFLSQTGIFSTSSASLVAKTTSGSALLTTQGVVSKSLPMVMKDVQLGVGILNSVFIGIDVMLLLKSSIDLYHGSISSVGRQLTQITLDLTREYKEMEDLYESLSLYSDQIKKIDN